MCKINRLCLKVHPRIEQVDSYILYFLLREYELNINPKSRNHSAIKMKILSRDSKTFH